MKVLWALWLASAALSLASAALLGCETRVPEPTDKGTSPNASIKPAPLGSGDPNLRADLQPKVFDGGVVGIPADSAGRLIMPPDAGLPPPTPLRSDESLSADEVSNRDGSGLSLSVEWRFGNTDKAPTGVVANTDVLETLRDKTRPLMTVDLASVGRMRISLDSVVFPLPPGTELKSRIDRTGHVVVWPNRQAYRNLAPGALRALFAERRTDVTPLVTSKRVEKGKGSGLGFDTTKVELSSGFGTLELELARVPGSGPAGILFCRFLVELIAVDPSNEACGSGLVPINAKYAWKPQGSISLTVTNLVRRSDLRVGELRVPPSGALVKPGELPPQTSGILLPHNDLQAMRRSPVESITPEPDAPGEGVRAINHTDGLRYLLLDGVAVAWVEPRGQAYVIGPVKSHYNIAWRDFLGGNITPATKVALPAQVTLGKPPPDGGAQNPPPQ